MYALMDCNNFYVSCERVFRPDWDNKPVIVLSNNDGCAVSRSEEAKALGIPMGALEFQMRDFFKDHGVIVRSSNYTLYGSMSNRVMKTASTFVPRLELYSIDEAFLDMHDMPHHNLFDLGAKIKRIVKQHTGIPVSIGIAPTKTLAKMANRYTKKKHREIGVYHADTQDKLDAILQFTEVENIWGVGSQYAKMLHDNGFHTAYDLLHAPDDFIRDKMTVVGARLLNELKGNPSIEWEFETPAKKNICTSRSFGKLLTEKKDISLALCTYTARCAEKLRRQNSCAKSLEVFLHTNGHRQQDKQYCGSIKIKLERATNDTGTLVQYARKALDIIFKSNHNYVKCGCMVMDLVPAGAVQNTLFGNNDTSKKDALNKAMDKINFGMGKRDFVRTAAQGFTKPFALRCDNLSLRYTTNINELRTIQ